MVSLQNMYIRFFSYDHPNYARYTTVYILDILDLPLSHPGAEELLSKNRFCVNRSEAPHPEMRLTSPLSKQSIVMQNSLALWVSIETTQHTTDGAWQGMLEPAIIKQMERADMETQSILYTKF